jgi:proteic killer suppression protein
VIESFRDEFTLNLYLGKKIPKSKIPTELHKIAQRKLDMLNSAKTIEDLRIPPNNRLEKLKGELKDYWSIRINDKYRIIFRFENGNAYDVFIDDYHN